MENFIIKNVMAKAKVIILDQTICLKKNGKPKNAQPIILNILKEAEEYMDIQNLSFSEAVALTLSYKLSNPELDDIVSSDCKSIIPNYIYKVDKKSFTIYKMVEEREVDKWNWAEKDKKKRERSQKIT